MGHQNISFDQKPSSSAHNALYSCYVASLVVSWLIIKFFNFVNWPNSYFVTIQSLAKNKGFEFWQWIELWKTMIYFLKVIALASSAKDFVLCQGIWGFWIFENENLFINKISIFCTFALIKWKIGYNVELPQIILVECTTLQK